MGLIEDGRGAACVTGPESYWQRGCDDAKAGREPKPPKTMASGWRENQENTGYMNGWKFGRLAHYEPTHDEGSRAD
jgi:hypothetical protein